ncbi:MAG: alpha/beta hydrolase [Treponemataceae bacterium]|nr:alpha/beta hydrolase [Treponemataceae bacterium]
MAGSQTRKEALKKLRLLAYNAKSDVAAFRRKIDEAFYTPFLPNHVERTECQYGGIPCDVLSPEMYASRRIMFYIHGGSFVGGSRASHRNFCASLAHKAYSRTIVPEYRLAPSSAFPAAIEDIQAAFRALFTEEQISRSLAADAEAHGGAEPSAQPEIVIAADGAGASIATALLLNLRGRYRKCVSRLVLFSPWLNLSDTSPAKASRKGTDGVISGDCLIRSSDAYTYSSNFTNPLVSPVFAEAEQLADFPPVYIQMGGTELLLEDAKQFSALLRNNGCSCRLDTWEGMPHLFQMADDCFSEAHDALDAFAAVLAGQDGGGAGRQRFENKPHLELGIRSEA